MLDVARLSGNDMTIGLIEEAEKAAPEVRVFPFRTITGTSYTTSIRVGLPVTGFRDVNQGLKASKSTFEQRLIQARVFGGRVECDLAILQADPEGPERLKSIEAIGVAESAMQTLGHQVWYGRLTKGDKGFPGLQGQVWGDMLVNGGGDTNGALSSFYGVRFGAQDVGLIGGNDSTLTLGNWREETLRDKDDNPYPGEVADLLSWIGLECLNRHAVGRIANLGDGSGQGLTDSKIADLMAKFPAGKKPDMWFASTNQLRHLQQSRTVVITTGPTVKASSTLESVAPWPTEAFGIPIVETDSIVNTEALVAFE